MLGRLNYPEEICRYLHIELQIWQCGGVFLPMVPRGSPRIAIVL